jgi:hypothetical protein
VLWSLVEWPRPYMLTATGRQQQLGTYAHENVPGHTPACRRLEAWGIDRLDCQPRLLVLPAPHHTECLHPTAPGLHMLMYQSSIRWL